MEILIYNGKSIADMTDDELVNAAREALNTHVAIADAFKEELRKLEAAFTSAKGARNKRRVFQKSEMRRRELRARGQATLDVYSALVSAHNERCNQRLESESLI